MPNSSLPSLPPHLQTALGQLGRRWRWLTVLHGIGLFILSTTALLATGLLLDLVLPLPTSVRFVALGLVVAGISWAGYRLVISRVMAEISRAELAALVERNHPELEERLTSSVELIEETGSDVAGPLRELLLEETDVASRSVDFNSVLGLRAATIMLAWAGLSAVLMFGPLAVPDSGHALLMSRFFLPWSNLQRTLLYRVSVENGDRVVARGSDVQITVRVEWPRGSSPGNHTGSAPRNVWCRWTTSSGNTDRRLMERVPDTTTYTTTWPEVLEGFEFHVDADGSLSRHHTVRVVEPPAITGLRLDIVPPDYTGLPPRTTDAVVGDVTVLAGSRLTWRMQFNKPIQDARLKLAGQKNSTAWEAKLAEDGRQATVDVIAETGGPLQVELIDRDGLERDDQTYRRLIIRDDQPPTLTLSGHDRPTAVRPTDAIVVRAEATDDFGLRTLELELQVDPTTQDHQRIDPDRLTGRQAVEHFTIDLSQFKTSTGSRLTYRVRVTDNRQQPAPNETWSAPRVLLIDPEAQPPDLADVIDRQKDTRDRIEKARSESLAARTTLSGTRQEALVALKNQSPFSGNNSLRKTGADLRELAGRVDGIARQLAAHPLWRPLAPSADRIARTLLPAAAERIEPALEAALADKATRLGQADEDLAQVLSAFDHLLVEFDLLAALERDLLELDRLARRTGRLADDVDTLSALAGDGNAGETKIEEQQRQHDFDRRKQDLTKQHDDLREELDGLLDRRPEVLEAARQAQLSRLRALGLRARELAAPQSDLGRELEEETEIPPALPDEPTAAPGNPASTPLGRQQDLARQAASQALEIASQLGTDADAARDAARFARQAAQTARQLLGGQIEDSGNAAKTAARLAAAAAKSLEDATQAQPDPVLLRRGRDLANRQQTETRMLAAAAGSASGRRAVRVVGQQAITTATDLLVDGLDRVAARLASPPVELPDHGQQARDAHAAALTGRQSMDKAHQGLAKSQFKPAAAAAAQAAERLEHTARIALDAADISERPDTPVPERVGEQVTSAVEQLEQSRKGLAASRFDDPRRPGRKPGSKTGGKKGGKGKSSGGQAKGKGGKPGQKPGAGQPGKQDGPLSKTAKQLRQAARSLSQASKTLQPGQADPNKTAAPPGPNDPDSKDTSGKAGTGSSMAMELKRLEAELSRLSGRAWGRLPGTLKTEILQAARRDPNGDYARLIRFYFEEISRPGRERREGGSP
ncbi:MAG: DUF4175 domain-containing protein [Planctomycetales bacterium]|nr:DUF4175 domain-containing protein [Planctomycetales bacterium]